MASPLEYFKIEAVERLERLNSGLMALEQTPGDHALIDSLFREAHSLKGAAGVSGLTDVAEVCHKMEDLLSDVRKGAEQVTTLMVDALLAAADAVGEMVSAKAEGREFETVVEEIIERLSNLESAPPEEKESAKEGEDASATNADAEVDETKKPAEENSTSDPANDSGGASSVPAKSSVDDKKANQATASGEMRDPAPRAAPGSETVRVRIDMLETLSARTGELMASGDRLRRTLGTIRELQAAIQSEQNRIGDNAVESESLRTIAGHARRLFDDFASDCSAIESLIEEIHERVLDTRMLPISVLYDQLPRFVRDHSREIGVSVQLLVEGAETRVDRRALEHLRDPMIHLIRNTMCHGIEPPEERERLGKPPTGTVRLTATRRGDRIRICCEDDGRGVNRDAVVARAVQNGLISESEAADLSDDQARRLILQPGLSTASIITDVGGRGVGMDVVLSRVEELHGSLEIESEQGRFTRFVIEFPASAATIEGLLVEAAGNVYVIPAHAVVQTVKVDASALLTCGGEIMLNVEGRAVPVALLSNMLGARDDARESPASFPVVVLRHRDMMAAVGVDRLLTTQTIVAGGLGDHLRDVKGVTGAAILGSGMPALILDPALLTGDCAKNRALSPAVRNLNEEASPLLPVLVVDDSMTTRMMEQSILESAGYLVETAVDAQDALNKTKNASYSLFVVDVEMPGMNGFELTRKLRQIERFEETPIIMVTSLAREEHRREGLEAGVNAYIIKGEFDQNVLLDTAERLVNR